MLVARVATADTGDITFPFNLGTSVYSHRFASATNPAADTTLANQFVLSEFIGVGIFVTPTLRVGMNLQFSEAIVQPTTHYPNAFTQFSFLPQLNWKFWGPFTASFVPTISPWFGGKAQFGFGLQAVLGASVPFGKSGFSGVLALEVPLNILPAVTVGITPLLGISFRLPTPHTAEPQPSPELQPSSEPPPSAEPQQSPPVEPATEH
jgi:hypothetical protein